MMQTKSEQERVRHTLLGMYREAKAKNETARAAAIREVGVALYPDMSFERPEKQAAHGMTGKSVVDNSAHTDLSNDDLWLAYTEQLDGTAARKRREEQAREEEAATARFYRENPEAAPVDFR